MKDLEDDFITIWADYFLYQEKSRIWLKIIKLAELGQVNAISCWYMLKESNETNSIIENFAKNLLRQKVYCSYSELVLLSHYYLSYEGGLGEVSSRADSVRSYQEKMNNSIDCKTWEHYNMLYKHAIEKLMTLGFMDCGVKAMYVLSHLTGFKYDPLMLERYLEISGGELRSYAIKINKTFVRKQLLKMYKSEPKNTQVKWALAKNLVLFGNNAKQVKFGRKLLTELSIRDLKVESTHKYLAKSSVNVREIERKV